MLIDPDRGPGTAHTGDRWQPLVTTSRAPERAGRLRTLREAEDDADTVLGFLRAGLASRDIDPAETLWLIDLAPGDGERAWRVLRSLATDAPRAPTIRYLARCSTPRHQARLAAHPRLRPLIADGSLYLDGQGTGLPPHPLRNPPVVLAHEALSTLPQGLYASRHGRLLQAWSDGRDGIAWRAPGQRDGPTHLLGPYRHALDAIAFTLPWGGMEILHTLLEAAGGRLLLRASDLGAKDLSQIRLGALDRAAAVTRALPVNFEALARWHRSHGADSVRQSQHDDRGRVLHLALHDVPCGRLRECLPDLLAIPHPDDHAASLHALAVASARTSARTPPLSAEHCLALLHGQHGDPRALIALRRPIAEAAPTLRGAALNTWRATLAHCLDQYYPNDRAERVPTRIAELAIALHGWPLARRALRGLLRNRPEHAHGWRMLAQCRSRTGAAHAAELFLNRAAALSGPNPEIEAERQALSARLAAWRSRPGYRPTTARHQRLTLEPLDNQHAADFLRQYRDPHIGLMARLPAFTGPDALKTWIAARARQPSRLDYAVLHADLGLVGMVAAHRLGDSAGIAFWIGVDHQGKGLAAPALELLIRRLRDHGVTHLFALAYSDNRRSLRTLQRLGFAALPLTATTESGSIHVLTRRDDRTDEAEALTERARRFLAVACDDLILAEPAATESSTHGHRAPPSDQPD